MPDEFRARVQAVVARLRPGEVVSYGDVAAEAGFPGAARAVGSVLAHPISGEDDELPWWRVVTAAGRLVPGHESGACPPPPGRGHRDRGRPGGPPGPRHAQRGPGPGGRRHSAR